MSKKVKYIIASILAGIGFFSYLSLPYESHYIGLITGSVLMIFCFLFGLGILFDNDNHTKAMSVLLPVSFFVGFGLFAAVLPLSFWLNIFLSVFFGFVSYVLFLTENVFLVAFFLFDSLLSFKQAYYINFLFTFIISVALYGYHFWSVSIELPDDGQKLSTWSYILIPSLITAELSLIFSFWPVGVFKGSLYLVAVIYLILGLLQADIRERLFKKIWFATTWVGVAVFLAIIMMTGWR